MNQKLAKLCRTLTRQGGTDPRDAQYMPLKPVIGSVLAGWKPGAIALSGHVSLTKECGRHIYHVYKKVLKCPA